MTGWVGGGVRWWRVVVTILLLAVLAAFINLPAVLQQLRDADLKWMLAALLVVQLQIVASAMRWRMTAARLGLTLTTRRAVREYYIASLGNLSLPGGVGGDAARAFRVRGERGLGVALNSVVLERLAGQLALLFITLAGLALAPWLMAGKEGLWIEESAWLRAGSVAAFMVMAAGAAAVLILVFRRRSVGPVNETARPDRSDGALISEPQIDDPQLQSDRHPGLRSAVKTGSWSERFRGWLQTLGPAMWRVWFTDGQWLPQGALSIMIVASYVAVFALCARSLGLVLPMLPLLVLVPLILSSMVLPISVGGWGTRETAAVLLLPLAGLSTADSVTASVLYGVIVLVGSLPGAVMLLSAASR